MAMALQISVVIPSSYHFKVPSFLVMPHKEAVMIVPINFIELKLQNLRFGGVVDAVKHTNVCTSLSCNYCL